MTRKEKVLKFLEEEAQTPLLTEELAVILDVPREERAMLEQILNELTEEGAVVRTKKKRYGAAVRLGFIQGRFVGNERGFGFVERDGEEDLFIASDAVHGAMHGDLVLAKITSQPKHSRRQEGEIVRVIKRSE